VTLIGFVMAGAAAAAAAAPAAAPAQAAAGPDAAACAARSGRTALLVEVSGIRAHTGTLRLSLYPDDADAFLARGRYVRRVDVPVPARGAASVCVEVPGGPGRYALAVRHDENGNGRTDWGDGGGFSRNPALSLVNLRPRLEDVAFEVRPGVQRIAVRLAYPGSLDPNAPQPSTASGRR
jgi:uncharacterized protein (DUF2141 family)